MDNWLSEYAHHLSNLTPGKLDSLRPLLSENLEFRDPFNHSFTQDAFIAILEDMYLKLDQVNFDVNAQLQKGNEGVLYWTFSATSKMTGTFEFVGSSRVVLDKEGKIELHHDYWDGSELMQRLPLLGRIIRKLRQKMSHS